VARRRAGRRGSRAPFLLEPPETCAHRAVERLTSEICQALGPDTAIPTCLIRELVELYVRAKAAGNYAVARDVIKDLTKLLMPLGPRHSSAPVLPPDFQLPSDADLSHLSDDDLERVTGRKMTHLEPTTTTVKRHDEPDIDE